MSKPKTNLEIERGRIIAGRAQRNSDLDRLVRGKKVKIMVALPRHPYYGDGLRSGRHNIFYVDGVEVGHENEHEDDYPSEPLMAKILLAVNATVGTEGIPSEQTIDPETRRRRDEYKKNHLVNWSDDK